MSFRSSLSRPRPMEVFFVAIELVWHSMQASILVKDDEEEMWIIMNEAMMVIWLVMR